MELVRATFKTFFVVLTLLEPSALSRETTEFFHAAAHLERHHEVATVIRHASVTSTLQCVKECYVTATCVAVNVVAEASEDESNAMSCELLSTEASSNTQLLHEDGWMYIGE